MALVFSSGHGNRVIIKSLSSADTHYSPSVFIDLVNANRLLKGLRLLSRGGSLAAASSLRSSRSASRPLRWRPARRSSGLPPRSLLRTGDLEYRAGGERLLERLEPYERRLREAAFSSPSLPNCAFRAW